MILLLYVDDMFIAQPIIQDVNNLKSQLSKHFAMKDLCKAKQILRMWMSRDREADTLKLSQEEYVKRVLRRFSMQDAKSIGSPLDDHFSLSKE